MRPLGTQRPERPKSELAITNTKNAALARLARRAAWRGAAPHIDSSPRQDASTRETSRRVRPLTSVIGAEISRVDLCYYPLASTPTLGEAHEHNNVECRCCSGRRTEADYSASCLVLLACPRSRVARRASHGRWNAAGPRHHENDAQVGKGVCGGYRGRGRVQLGAPRNRACTLFRLCGVLQRDDWRGGDHSRASHPVHSGGGGYRVRRYHVPCALAGGLRVVERRVGMPAVLGTHPVRYCATWRRPLFARSQARLGAVIGEHAIAGRYSAAPGLCAGAVCLARRHSAPTSRTRIAPRSAANSTT